MPKPGRTTITPSSEISRFTNRTAEEGVFLRHLTSAGELPVLMFYGVGGIGKTWLLRHLREILPADIPRAFLDFDRDAGGLRFADDMAAALHEIRIQFGADCPDFDLAHAMLRFKQGAGSELSLRGSRSTETGVEFAAEVAQTLANATPGVNILAWLGKRGYGSLTRRLKGTRLGDWLAQKTGNQEALKLARMTAQEIYPTLLGRLREGMSNNLPVRLGRSCRSVLFLDSFEALTSALDSADQRERREGWVRALAADLDFVLVVVAGQNRLRWEEDDPEWANPKHLEQHLVGGLSAQDARLFLTRCGVDDPALQEVILQSCDEPETPGYHCYSLALHADVAWNETRRGVSLDPKTFALPPGDWDALARRFLKSLATDRERRWIERLALTPRFDETAARAAHSETHSAEQDFAWETLPRYSFVAPAQAQDWWVIRSQMRAALEHQAGRQKAIREDHQTWREHWAARSQAETDEYAGLSWFHWSRLEPREARLDWKRLAEAQRNAKPPRMQEHFWLLSWWGSTGLEESAVPTEEEANALNDFTVELREATVGSTQANIKRAIACNEAALRVYTAEDLPADWAKTQTYLGLAYWGLPTGDRGDNLRRAITCYEAALRVRTEQDFPVQWASTQNNLAIAYWDLPTGDRGDNLCRAIACCEAALRVRTEQEFPAQWAKTQNNLGIALRNLPTGDRGDNLRRAIACFEAALRVFTEQDFPANWAMTQHNLGNAHWSLQTGDRGDNLRRAIACYQAALRVYGEQDFPANWAITQNNLGEAYSDLPTDRADNLCRAIACYEAALRICTEQEFPERHRLFGRNLELARSELEGLS